MDSEEVARRLAAAVKERRTQLGMSQERVALAADQAGIRISAQTVREIEQGRRASVSEKTARALEAALQWPAGTVRDILAGEQPEPPAPAVAPSDEVAALRAEVDQLKQMVAGEPKADDVRTVAATLRMLSPEMRRVFRKALVVVEHEDV